MIFVVHLLGWSTGLNVPSTKHNEVPDFIDWGILSFPICVPAHAFPGFTEAGLSCLVHRMHPMRETVLAGLKIVAAGGFIVEG